jgi:hypothetical protein
MNPAALPLIKLGLDTLISLWAIHENKPPGWKPSAEDWAKLRAEVDAATPENVLARAKQIVDGLPTATQE